MKQNASAQDEDLRHLWTSVKRSEQLYMSNVTQLSTLEHIKHIKTRITTCFA